jgi:ferredoxin-NADP reductase
MKTIVKIKSISHVTHDVLRIKTERPVDFNFVPGQATEISINNDGWQNEKRPFTFTCLPEDDYLEFTIKTYPSRKGVTNELLKLKNDDELILHDVFGAIHYEGEGVFIAGGAGVTPFIAIFRDLHSKNKIGENKLIFSNKTKGDIILKEEFENLLGKNFINILSEEKSDDYPYGHISEDFLKANISEYKKYFYLCGPPPMMEAVEKQLSGLNVERNLLIEEDF